jgi:hypothetical protein
VTHLVVFAPSAWPRVAAHLWAGKECASFGGVGVMEIR